MTNPIPRSGLPAFPTAADFAGFGAPPATPAPSPMVPPSFPTLGEHHRAKVEEASQARKMLLGGEQADLRTLATAQVEGNDLANDPFLQEISGLKDFEIEQIYGRDVANRVLELSRYRNEIATNDQIGRTFREGARDSVLGVSAGALQSIGGLASLGAGLVSDDAGAFVSGLTNDASEAIRGEQTWQLDRAREQDSYRAEADDIDIAAAYEDDLANDRPFAGLRRLGREISSSATNLASNPMLAGDLVAEGAGSLVTSLGINGVVVRAGAKMVLSKMGLEGAEAAAYLATPAGKQLLQSLATKGMPASIGLQEAGGTYAQIQAEIQGMSEAELAEGSEDYRNLRAEGKSHETARNEIANMAGIEGGAIQGMVGGVLGMGVAKFEAGLLRPRTSVPTTLTESLRDVGENILRETVEETGQGASSELISNTVIKDRADNDRDVMQGLGSALVENAVAGAGMGAAVQAPRLAFDTARAAGRGVVAAGERRMESINQKDDDESPVGDRATREALNTLVRTMPQVAVASAPVTPEMAAGTPEATPEAAAETPVEMTAGQRIYRATNMTADEGNSTPASIRTLFLGNDVLDPGMEIPRAAALNAVAEEIMTGKLDGQTELDAALWLQEQSQYLQGIRDTDAAELSPEAQQDFQEMRSAIEVILSNDKIQKILDRSYEVSSSDFAPMPEVTPASINTPEVQEAISRQVAMSLSNPAGVDPRFVNQVLDQVGRDMRPEVRARLQAAAQLAQMAETSAAEKAALEEAAQRKVRAQEGGTNAKVQGTTDVFKKGISDVKEDVKTRGRRQDKRQWGLSQHVAEIVGALNRGAPGEAKVFLNNLRNFTRHYENKIAAYEESAAKNGSKVFFEVWDGGRFLEKGHEGTKPVWLNSQSPNSVLLFEEAKIDAALVSNVYNMMTTLYGDQLGAEPMAAPVVAAPVAEPVAETVTETAPEPTPEPTPEAPVEASAMEEDLVVIEDEPVTPLPVEPEVETVPAATAAEAPAETEVVEVATQQDPEIVPESTEDMDTFEDNSIEDPVERLGDLVRQLNEIDSDALIGPQRRGKRAMELVKVRNGGRIYDAWEVVFDLAYDVSDAGFERLGAAFNDTASDLLELSNELFNQETDEDATDASTPREESTAAQEEAGSTVGAEQATQAPGGEETGTAGGAEGTPAGGEAAEAEVGAGDGDQLTAPTFDNLAKDRSGESPFQRAYKIDPTKAPLLQDENPLATLVDNLADTETANTALKPQVPLEDTQRLALRNMVMAVSQTIDKMNDRLTRKTDTLKSLAVRDANGKVVKSGQPLSPLEALDYKEKDFINFRNGHMLALVDTETGQYDRRLVQAAGLGALNWVLNARPMSNPDLEDVAKMFGVKESEVTPLQRQMARLGFYGKTAVEGMAKEIMAFWGADINPDITDSDVRGIVEGLAIEFLVGMEDILVTPVDVPLIRYDNEGNVKTVKVRGQKEGVVPTVKALLPQHPSTQEDFMTLQETSMILAETLLPPGQSEQPRPFIGVVPPLSGSLKGPMTRGQDVRKALENHNKTPFYRNNNFMRMVKAMGRENYLKLRGWREYDEEVTHRQDVESIEGRNRGLERAWDEVMNHDMRVTTVSELTGTPLDQLGTYHQWYVGSNGRIMAKGFSGQADKLMRELYVATVSELNLSSEADRDRFWMTVAQSLGVKTEIVKRADAVAEAQALAAKVPQTIAMLRELGDEMTPAQFAMMEAELDKAGLDVSDKALHALQAVADYRNHEAEHGFDNAEAPRFWHSLALEADGKTDGPMNGLVHYLTGLFAPEHLENLAMGGLTLNQAGVSLNDHAATHGKDDLYTTAAQLTTLLVTKMVSQIPFGETREQARMEALQQAQSLLRFLTYFGDGDLMLDDKGNLTIGRKTLKNPLTITMYGSGSRGIAGKVASAATELYYSKISDLLALRKEQGNPNLTFQDLPALRGYADLDADIQNLFTRKIVESKKEGNKGFLTIGTLGPKGKQRKVRTYNKPNMKDFMFTNDNMEMFQENVLKILVEPMGEAIEQKLGSANDTMKLAIDASSIQSTVVQDAFATAVAVKKQELKEQTGRDMQLSQNDLKDIFRSLEKLGVVIEGVTDNEHYLNLTGSTRGTDGTDFARGLGNEWSGDSSITEVDKVGVSIAPMVTISRGDARMMIKYYAGEDASLKALQVFDGLEMAADEIESTSRAINKAWTEMAFENPMKDVSDSFRNWIRQDPLNNVSSRYTFMNILRTGDSRLPSQARYMVQAYMQIVGKAAQELGIPADEYPADLTMFDEDGNVDWSVEILPSPHDEKLNAAVRKDLLPLAEQAVASTAYELEDASISIEARKEVLKGITFSADHMASGETPYTHEGGEIIPGDTDAVIAELNNRYEAAYNRIQAERGITTNRPVIQEPLAAFVAQANRLGRKIRNQDIRRLKMDDALELFRAEGVTEDQQNILRAMRRVLPEFEILIGDAAVLTEYRNKNYPSNAGAGSIQMGQTDFTNGIIYIANTAPETVLHEMLHGALYRQLTEYYGNEGASLSANEKAAITNIEQMMYQFLNLDFTKEPPREAVALGILREEILNHFNDAEIGTAKAMAEFISWGLTNQNISETLKTVKTQGRMEKLKGRVVAFVKRLLGLPNQTKMDVFSNLQLNTASLLIDGRPWAKANRNEQMRLSGVLNQVSGIPEDQRLSRLAESFNNKIKSHLLAQKENTPKGKPKTWKVEERQIAVLSTKAVNTFSQFGFLKTPQEKSTFRQIQAALASSMELNGAALVRIQKLFNHVMQEFDAAQLPGNEERWERMFNLLTGTYGTEKDAAGRSNLMASFLALGQVDPDFREMLSKISVPKGEIKSDGSLDGFLSSRADEIMNDLASTISGEGRRNSSVQASLDRLALTLAKIDQDDENFVEKKIGSILGTGDGKGRAFLSEVSERLERFGNKNSQRLEARSNMENLLRGSAKIAAAVLDEGKGQAMAEALTSFGNKSTRIPESVLETMNEIFGMTDTNRGVYKMINLVRTAVQGVRQDHREILPVIFQEQFSRPLKDVEWTQLYKAIGKTDLAALAARFQTNQLRGFLEGGQAWNSAITTLEAEIAAEAPTLAQDYLAKAEELAEFMMNGNPPKNHDLLRNAYAISRMVGTSRMGEAKSTPKLVSAIDQLVTLYAIGKLDDETKEAVTQLAKTEAEGFDFLALYLGSLRERETQKHSVNEVARINGYKGYIPAEVREGADLMVADDSEKGFHERMGYTRLGNYEGSGVEGGKKGYYVSTVSGVNTYSQGAMQTVNTSFMGVDPRTGYSVNGTTAGRISGQYLATVKGRLQAQRGSRGEPLLPVFDASGEVVAYERSIAPERLSALDPNSNLGEMIGAWAGRQAEEELAQRFNERLVDELWNVWNREKTAGRRSEFVNLADRDLKDPIYKDSWKMVPREMREYIRQKFGDDGFPVMRNMIPNSVGFREASVADPWTGISRMSPQAQKAFQDAATAVLGKNAFKILVTAEKYWKAGISVARTTIVIRSIIVPASNLASNFVWLAAAGVAPTKIAKGFTSKLVEINQYLANEERKVRINALLARHRNDRVKVKKLKTELQGITDSNKRMSIWPLIEAGEFSTISEGLTEADAAIGSGSLSEWMQSKIEQVPSQLGTVGRYAMITRDTALFKGMSRATQYGDFLAKAVLYDHMIAEGKSQEETMNRITEEFVNYNLQAGRSRNYAESMGLTWFWAYKLRVMKRALSLIRTNPFRALLLSTGVPLLPDVPIVDLGTPLSDNMASVIAKGSLPYSVGFGQLWNAPSLNPWVNIAN